MSVRSNLRTYWPWYVAFLWLLLYELWALATHHVTLSRLVWRGAAAWPALPVLVAGVVVVLLLHFFVRRFRG